MTNLMGAVDMNEYAEASGTVTFVAQTAANQETKAAPSAACAQPAEARRGRRVLHVRPESVLCTSPSLPTLPALSASTCVGAESGQ
ncbi:hypothetical protein RKD38_007681 [Streptomyces ambofaciens]